MRKWILLAVISAAAFIIIMIIRTPSIYASAGQTASCLSCHSQSSSLKVTTNVTTKTVSPGQSFPVGISWSGGTSGQRLEINWPNTQSNGLFSPNPRIPYSSTSASGTTTSTLTAPSTAGTYTVRVFVARGIPEDTNYADIVITVGAANSPPVLSAIGNKTVTAGQLLQFTISATDPNNNPLTYSASGLPTGATFNAASRTLSWTPSAAGTYPNLIFTVSDGSLTASETITITVVVGNAPPSLVPIGNKAITAGQRLQFTISGSDPNNDPLTYSASGLPAGAIFTTASRTFSWTPATPGTYSNVLFTVSDGSLTTSETITITVSASNSAPVLNAIGNKTATAGQLLQFTVSATDPNNDPLTYSASNLPAGASFDASSHSFSWTPVGAGSFSNVTFQVSDGSLTASEAITITVDAAVPPVQDVSSANSSAPVNPPAQGLTSGNRAGEVNLPPVLGLINNKTAAVGQLIQLVISASDPNSDPLAFSASNLPAGASFDALSHIFSWAPATSGTYSNITFQVSDGVLTTSQTLTITVTAKVNLPPVLGMISNKTAVVGQLTQFVISAIDPNDDPLTYSASNLPAGASFDASTRTFSWTPAQGQVGTHDGIHFEVSDGSLTHSKDIKIVVVNGDTTPPKINGKINLDIKATSATISWTTDEPSSSQVEYWENSRKFSPLDKIAVTNHVIELTDLTPGTNYRYSVLSMDAAGNVVSSIENTLTTLQLFTVSGLTLNPSKAHIGEEVIIGVTVINNQEVSCTCKLQLKIGGVEESTSVVDLAAGEQRIVSFKTTRNNTGVLSVDINGTTGSLVVLTSGTQTNNGFPIGIAAVLSPVFLCGVVVLWHRKLSKFKV